MKKHPWKYGQVYVQSVVVFLWVLALPLWAQSKSAGFYIRPYLQNVSPEAVTLMWETHTPAVGVVEFGIIQFRGVRTASFTFGAREERPAKIHKIRLSRLYTGTNYIYRVKADDEVHTGFFSTPVPHSNHRVRFVVLGDSRFWGDTWQKSPLPKHMMAHKPAFLLHMGDLVNNGLVRKEWPAHFQRFAPSIARVPMIPVRGNHEGDGREVPERDWFAKYHDLPGGEPVTSFDWGPAHFAFVSYTHWDQVAELLEKDLATTFKRWKIVGTHYPVYCTGYWGPFDDRKSAGNAALESVLDKHKVDAYLGGHTHIYERCFAMRDGQRNDRDGTLYLTQGGKVGGHYPDRWTARLPVDFDAPHYTLVEITDDMLELRTYGLKKGDATKPAAAQVVEVDHCIRWRDEAQPKKLLAAFADAKGDELVTTIERLGAMMYAPAASVLVHYLDHDDKRVCYSAATALANIASLAVAPQLLTKLSHPDVVVQRHLARSLEAAMPAALADRVAPFVLEESRDVVVRKRLLGALLLHAPEKAFAVAHKVLADKNKSIRHRAADVMKRTASKRDGPVLLSLFKKQDDPFVYRSMAWGLHRLTGVGSDLGKLIKADPAERDKWAQQWREAMQ